LTFVAFVAFVACGFSLFWRLWLLGDMLHNSCKQNENNRQNKRTTLMLRRTRFNTSLLRSTLWNSLFQIVNGWTCLTLELQCLMLNSHLE
jgi:hypothetical protein